MRYRPDSAACVRRRTEEGKTNREIIRCLRRYLAARSTGTYSAARSHRRPVPSHSTDREPRQRQWPKGLFDTQRSVNAVAETFVATREKELIHRRSSPGREELRREVLDCSELLYDLCVAIEAEDAGPRQTTRLSPRLCHPTSTIATHETYLSCPPEPGKSTNVVG